MKAYHKLEQHRKNLAEGFFESVIKESMQVIEQSETEPPADVALYALGEVYAHHDYPGKNYSLSLQYFEKLIRNFPNSYLTSEAKTYVSLIKSIKTDPKEVETVLKPDTSGEIDSFKKAVQENLEILKEAGSKTPADKALYNLGLIYAHKDNPEKDFTKSQTYLHQLTTQYPDSKFNTEANVILGLLETIRQIQQIDFEIELQRKKLVR